MTFKLRSDGGRRIRVRRPCAEKAVLTLSARNKPRPWLLLFLVAAGVLLAPLWVGRKWQTLKRILGFGRGVREQTTDSKSPAPDAGREPGAQNERAQPHQEYPRP